MEEVKINIQQAGDTITILEGKAPDPLPLREPKIINISGDIHSISNFLTKRKEGHSLQAVDKNKVVVIADKTNRTIVMHLDPENHYGSVITAKLEESDELKPFGINKEKMFRREELYKLIKFSRIFFDDKEKHAALLLALSKIRLKTETELQAHSDSKGNRGASIEKKTVNDEGFIHNFFMVAPLFKGEPNVKFPVEICYDAGDSGIMFWLESPELKEMMDSSIDEIFNTELSHCAEFVIINQ